MDDSKSEEEMDDNESEEEMDDNDEERDSDEEVCMEGDGDSAEVSSGGELEEEGTDCVTPTDTFERLLTPDLVSHILTEINRYGEQYTDDHADYLAAHPRARAHDFLRQKFSLAEIYR